MWLSLEVVLGVVVGCGFALLLFFDILRRLDIDEDGGEKQIPDDSKEKKVEEACSALAGSRASEFIPPIAMLQTLIFIRSIN